ncbi:carboxymuconolactone decarboxylase family protein [Janibacter sp. GS2]|uniref:carboxymuconolactone decarboxylase family protein n=1 Tax=Janibacter sp. GS2 TaxID=3442646 RepID=UPI003EBD28E7
MDHWEYLRHLTLDSHEPAAPPGALDAKARSLVRLGALVAVLATAPSVRAEIDVAVSTGATAAEIVDVLDTVLPVVGRPRVVAAAPKVALALGDDLDLLDDPG